MISDVDVDSKNDRVIWQWMPLCYRIWIWGSQGHFCSVYKDTWYKVTCKPESQAMFLLLKLAFIDTSKQCSTRSQKSLFIWKWEEIGGKWKIVRSVIELSGSFTFGIMPVKKIRNYRGWMDQIHLFIYFIPQAFRTFHVPGSVLSAGSIQELTVWKGRQL